MSFLYYSSTMDPFRCSLLSSRFAIAVKCAIAIKPVDDRLEVKRHLFHPLPLIYNSVACGNSSVHAHYLGRRLDMYTSS
jgi:hypothetical protein